MAGKGAWGKTVYYARLHWDKAALFIAVVIAVIVMYKKIARHWSKTSEARIELPGVQYQSNTDTGIAFIKVIGLNSRESLSSPR